MTPVFASVNLNPEQKAAVRATEGPCLVVAGPGSGKTRTLSAKAIHIFRRRPDRKILCITHTRKAADEMRARIKKHPNTEAIKISTIHSLCYRILRKSLGKPVRIVSDYDHTETLMERQFPETFNIYRGKAALQVSFSPELGLIFFNLAPAIPGMENKMPTNGARKYQWERKLTVSFNFEGALEVAATAEALMQGKESLVADSEGNLPSWYRYPSKTGRQGNAKTLGVYRPRNQPQGSKVTYYLGIVENTKDKEKNKVGIALEHADLFKIACVMKEAALALLGWRDETQERSAREARQEKDPLTSSQKAPAYAGHADRPASKKEEIF